MRRPNVQQAPEILGLGPAVRRRSRLKKVRSLWRATLALFVTITVLVNHSINAFETDPTLKRSLIESHQYQLEQLSLQPELRSLIVRPMTQEHMRFVLAEDQTWPIDHQEQQKRLPQKLSAQLKYLVNDPQFRFSEILLTDWFGGLISSYPGSTDFWQGDETKFIEPFKTQEMYISEAQWDQSSNTYSFHMAIPIESNGQIIGVLIGGIDVTSENLNELSLSDLLKLNIQTK